MHHLFFSLFLILLCLTDAPPTPGVKGETPQMLMSPWLQAVTPTGISVLVESTSDDPVVVEYGPTASYGLRAQTTRTDLTTEGTFVHLVRLSGLREDTKYHYRVAVGAGMSTDAAFRTAPTSDVPIRFCWFADCRSGTAVHDRMADLIRKEQPRFSLYGGDLCLSSTYSSYKKEFFRPNQLNLIASVPFFLTPGNHEKWDTNTRAFTEAPSSLSGTDAYFSFDYGPLHVLVLNSEMALDEESPQYRFAERDILATTKSWKIVVAHKPAYVSGGHRGDSDLKRMCEKIFRRGGVQVVFAGHSHFYQHNFIDGIHHMIIGSAGAPLYPPTSASFTLKSLKDYCYGVCDVDPATFRLAVYNDNRELLDTLELTR